MKTKASFYRDCVEWDIVTWKRAFQFWEKYATIEGGFSEKSGLEIGANQGGASLFFANRFGSDMVCSDISSISTANRRVHQQYQGAQMIHYKQFDARAIPYPNGTFDFVVFKSVLGVIGAKNKVEDMVQALQEIYRVLKPGGMLFFAENLCGSRLHQVARKKFVPWGNSWRYLSLVEMECLLGGFSKKEMHTTGFFTAFVPKPEWLKGWMAHFDALLFFVPKSWRYVVFGVAVK